MASKAEISMTAIKMMSSRVMGMDWSLETLPGRRRSNRHAHLSSLRRGSGSARATIRTCPQLIKERANPVRIM
jgi:hypothetical protein